MISPVILTPLFDRVGACHQAAGVDAKGRPFCTRPRICARCGGAGRSDKWAHTGFTCFDCGGSGQGRGDPVVVRLFTADDLARLNAKAAIATEKRVAKAVAATAARQAAADAARQARADMLSADPLFARLTAFAPRNEFVASMRTQIETRDLSEAQEAAVVSAIARIEAQDAAAANSRHVGTIGERLTIAGTVEGARCVREASWDRPACYLNRVRTPDGALIVWFGAYPLDDGAAVFGTATVKEHSEFRGEKQTAIKNPRWRAEAA